MTWIELYEPGNCPTVADVAGYIKNPRFTELCDYLQCTYKVEPKCEYSCCSMQKGWNVKYKKSGKALCTIYPMDGYFIALIVMGKKELPEAEFAIQTCGEAARELFERTAVSMDAKWLMLEVRTERDLEDAKTLISLRVPQKK